MQPTRCGAFVISTGGGGLGDTEAEGLIEYDGDTLGETLAEMLRDRLGDGLCDRLALGECDADGERLADGLTLAEAPPVGDAEADGLTLAEGETDGLTDGDSDGDALADGEPLALGDTEGEALPDGEPEADGLPDAEGDVLADGLTLGDGVAEALADGDTDALADPATPPSANARISRWVASTVPHERSNVPFPRLDTDAEASVVLDEPVAAAVASKIASEDDSPRAETHGLPPEFRPAVARDWLDVPNPTEKFTGNVVSSVVLVTAFTLVNSTAAGAFPVTVTDCEPVDVGCVIVAIPSRPNPPIARPNAARVPIAPLDAAAQLTVQPSESIET